MIMELEKNWYKKYLKDFIGLIFWPSFTVSKGENEAKN